MFPCVRLFSKSMYKDGGSGSPFQGVINIHEPRRSIRQGSHSESHLDSYIGYCGQAQRRVSNKRIPLDIQRWKPQMPFRGSPGPYIKIISTLLIEFFYLINADHVFTNPSRQLVQQLQVLFPPKELFKRLSCAPLTMGMGQHEFPFQFTVGLFPVSLMATCG